MCGIVGYVGAKPAAPILVDGLARLEYRGYDSAGVAVLGPSEIRLHRDAVRVVAAGDALLAPSITRTLIADFARRPQQNRPRPDQLRVLTPRETEVLKLIAAGRSNGEIADTLVLAEQTVKTHVGRILMKLDLRDRAQAVVIAYETGLVQPGG